MGRSVGAMVELTLQLALSGFYDTDDGFDDTNDGFDDTDDGFDDTDGG